MLLLLVDLSGVLLIEVLDAAALCNGLLGVLVWRGNTVGGAWEVGVSSGITGGTGEVFRGAGTGCDRVSSGFDAFLGTVGGGFFGTPEGSETGFLGTSGLGLAGLGGGCGLSLPLPERVLAMGTGWSASEET